MRNLILCVLLALAGCELMPPGPASPQPPPPQPQPQKPPQAPAPPPSAEEVARALTELNAAFKAEYERVLAERGTRRVQASRSEAFNALLGGLTRLGMIVENRDAEAGILTVAAPAPRPLSNDEWRRTVETDGPMMAAILCRRLGAYCRQIKFEPDDYVIVINATILATARDSSEVSLTTRMREIQPRPGVPRRDYPPPTGVRMALDKIWAQFEQQLAQAKR
jgi:hypothetical protein